MSLLRQFEHSSRVRRNLTHHSHNQLNNHPTQFVSPKESHSSFTQATPQSIPHSLSFRRNLIRHSHNQLHNPSHTVCHSTEISLLTHTINSTIHPTQFVIASPIRAKLSSPQESHSSLTQSTLHSLSFRRNLTLHSHNQLHNPSHTVYHVVRISLI